MGPDPEALASLRRMAETMTAETPLSAALLVNVIDDIENEGPIAQLIAGHEALDEPLFCLRLLGGVSHLHETGCAPDLSNHLSGGGARYHEPAFIEESWHHFLKTLLGHPLEVIAALERPVQQHHPGRAGLLLRGLGMLRAKQVRLLELGACAGLNLLLDKYWWSGDGWQWGTRSSSVRLTAPGPAPGSIEIVDRAGCDLAPRDPRNPDDVAIVRSFLPYERDVDRNDFDAAIDLARSSRVRVDRCDAQTWLERELKVPWSNSVTTVVWNCMFSGYLSASRQMAIDRLLEDAARSMPLVRISYEPENWAAIPRLQVTIYS